MFKSVIQINTDKSPNKPQHRATHLSYTLYLYSAICVRMRVCTVYINRTHARAFVLPVRRVCTFDDGQAVCGWCRICMCALASSSDHETHKLLMQALSGAEYPNAHAHTYIHTRPISRICTHLKRYTPIYFT